MEGKIGRKVARGDDEHTFVVRSSSSMSRRINPETEIAPKSTSTTSAVAGTTYSYT